MIKTHLIFPHLAIIVFVTIRLVAVGVMVMVMCSCLILESLGRCNGATMLAFDVEPCHDSFGTHPKHNIDRNLR